MRLVTVVLELVVGLLRLEDHAAQVVAVNLEVVELVEQVQVEEAVEVGEDVEAEVAVAAVVVVVVSLECAFHVVNRADIVIGGGGGGGGGC